jgi:hypothetical protein
MYVLAKELVRVAVLPLAGIRRSRKGGRKMKRKKWTATKLRVSRGRLGVFIMNR